ncbi:BgTH12-06185 [Blumeria graminis f. sp. triticale]|uniref:BgTH12-06185 n=1 Tax=Blumeria graminis f. sp. triticale TaxID=1689686 RepID=A0A9W4GGX5_BLUGR|nr:BgTH12-06185 [Blumeria graminis f. sp. triticale]
MENSPDLEPSEVSTPSSNLSENARIRKERREAKIRASGSARLSKITGLGGSNKESESHITQGPCVFPKSVERSYDESRTSPVPGDPATIDQIGLKQEEWPNSRASTVQINELLGMKNAATSEDPMMKILQQMMGGIPGEGSGGMPSFQNTPSNTQAASTTSHSLFWRIIHALCALSLGLYVAITTQFTGSKIMREHSLLGYNIADGELLFPDTINVFYIFVTLETILFTTQYLLEKERVQLGGITGMAMELVPEPIKRYLQWGLRYFDIWMAISRDAMIFIFVLGAYAWFKGEQSA